MRQKNEKTRKQGYNETLYPSCVTNNETLLEGNSPLEYVSFNKVQTQEDYSFCEHYNNKNNNKKECSTMTQEIVKTIFKTGVLNQEDLKELNTSQGLSQRIEEKRSKEEINNAIEKMITSSSIIPNAIEPSPIVLLDYNSLKKEEKEEFISFIKKSGKDIRNITNIPCKFIPEIINNELLGVNEVQYKFNLKAFNPEVVSFSFLFTEYNKKEEGFIWEETNIKNPSEKEKVYCYNCQLIKNNKTGSKVTVSYSIVGNKEYNTYSVKRIESKNGNVNYSPVMKSNSTKEDARLKLNQIFKGKDKITSPKTDCREKLDGVIGQAFTLLTDYGTFQNNESDRKETSKQIEKIFNRIYGLIKAIENN